METQAERLGESNEGNGSTDAASEVVTVFEPALVEGTVPEEIQGSPRKPPAGYENVPQELWPREDGSLPELTPELIRRLRGKYFTVRHVPLGCGHKLDVIKEPDHRNCETCWFYFWNTHPQLVEVTDQMYRTLGAKAVAGLRGDKYVKLFRRYMATMYHIQEMKKNVTLNQERANADSSNSTVEQAREGSHLSTEAPHRGEEKARLSSGLVTQ